MDASFEQTHQRYQATLESALDHFRSLLGSANSHHWKPVPPSSVPNGSTRGHFGDGQSNGTRQLLNGIGPIDASNVQVHRRKIPGATVVRAVCELTTDPARVDVDDFRAVLQTAEVRGMWDNLVDKASVIEVLDPQTRIIKTDFRLGWPANPRDSITISKTFSDPSTVIDISTSLPRSSDEPAYLRASPPFVRSHVHLLAWCIQFSPNPTCSHVEVSPSPKDGDHDTSRDESLPKHVSQQQSTPKPGFSKGRITVFWNVNWKGAIFSTHHSQIAALLNGFVDYVRTQASQIPMVSSYGHELDFGSVSYDKQEEKLNITYSILPQESSTEDSESLAERSEKPNVEFEGVRLQRAIELKLPSDQSWDVHIKAQAQGEGVDESWETIAEKTADASRTVLRITHAKLLAAHQLVRVKVVVQRLAGGKSLRVNHNPVKATLAEMRSVVGLSQPLLDDTRSISNFSLQTGTTEGSKLVNDVASTMDGSAQESFSPAPTLPVPPLRRPDAMTRAHVISTQLRRSYIYFSSLLQEPEAKWRHVADARGVTVTQLQSIDPTLTVYRAEATFVGVGVWNVFSAITTVGARMWWDKSLAEVTLLEDLNELSSLWHVKQKGAWPVAPRDAVLITTTYKSPTSVHLFSVSTDDSNLFPSIQPPSAGYIRTRTEILGWSVELLSPTTTQITLIDQHDPLGWSPKSWTPAQLIAQVASLGEFALKSGGPPIITRVSGARVTMSKYEHDKGIFRAEYTASDNVLASALMDPSSSGTSLPDSTEVSLVECELRCDCETWASSLDIVVDPPPTKATCLKRHKLSSGGGWWIMIEHEASLLQHEKAKILIRRGRVGRDSKNSVFLNGTNLRVDVEELSDEEAKSLATRRRVKASLIPLDQYPLCGPRLWRNSPSASDPCTRSTTPVPDRIHEAPAVPTPDQAPLKSLNMPSKPSEPLRSSFPMTSALEALASLQAFHIEQGPDIMVPPAGWTLVAEKGTSSVYKKTVSQISEVFPVYRADQVIEGVTAEEMVATLAAVSTRPLWDDRVEKASLLESYGHGCTTQLLTTKPTFPFKARLLQTANVHALVQIPSASVNSSMNTVHFIATASFTRSNEPLGANHKLNPLGLVEGNVLLEGWIMETIDPYSSSSHAIPSTRCTYFNAIDYGGSVPVAFSSMMNSSLPRVISGLEMLVKSHGPLPKLCRPVFGLRLNGSLGRDGIDDWQWKLHGVDRSTVAVSVDTATKAAFQGTFLIHKGANEPMFVTSPLSGGGSGGPSSAHSTSRYESIRQLGVAVPPASDPTGGSAFVRRLVSTPDLHRKTSGGQIRRIGTTNGTALHGMHLTGTKAPDLVVGELALDRKLYPSGCRISWKASFLKSGAHVTIEREVGFPDSMENESEKIPIEVSVHEMPSPAVFAASLDPAARREHVLLRMTLPVGIIHYPIKDPLTSSPDTEASPPPLWYSGLSKRDAVVHVRIEPLGASQQQGEGEHQNEANRGKNRAELFRVIVNGDPKKVIPIRESQLELDRWEVNDYTGACPLIARVIRLAKANPKRQSPPLPLSMDILPPELERPCAIAAEFVSKAEDDSSSSPVPGSAVETPHTSSPVNEVNEQEDDANKNQTHGTNLLTVDSSSRGSPGTFTPLSEILGSYPLQQLGSATRAILTRRRTYTTRHLILTGLIAFLIGSLLRSLLLPSDFIVIPPGATESESKLVHLLGNRRHWREARRLIELRLFVFRNWSLVLAAVRSHS